MLHLFALDFSLEFKKDSLVKRSNKQLARKVIPTELILKIILLFFITPLLYTWIILS